MVIEYKRTTHCGHWTAIMQTCGADHRKADTDELDTQRQAKKGNNLIKQVVDTDTATKLTPDLHYSKEAEGDLISDEDQDQHNGHVIHCKATVQSASQSQELQTGKQKHSLQSFPH
jgi:hypothetical protein